jgi:hypothetical protein
MKSINIKNISDDTNNKLSFLQTYYSSDIQKASQRYVVEYLIHEKYNELMEESK